MAEWLRRGLQILAPRFDSGRGLQIFLPLFLITALREGRACPIPRTESARFRSLPLLLLQKSADCEAVSHRLRLAFCAHAWPAGVPTKPPVTGANALSVEGPAKAPAVPTEPSRTRESAGNRESRQKPEPLPKRCGRVPGAANETSARRTESPRARR